MQPYCRVRRPGAVGVCRCKHNSASKRHCADHDQSPNTSAPGTWVWRHVGDDHTPCFVDVRAVVH